MSWRFDRTLRWTAVPTAILTLGTAGNLSPRAPTSSAATSTVFVGVSVVPMDHELVLANQTVLVQGDRIAAVGPDGSIPIPEDAQWVDAAGKYLLPGLI